MKKNINVHEFSEKKNNLKNHCYKNMNQQLNKNKIVNSS